MDTDKKRRKESLDRTAELFSLRQLKETSARAAPQQYNSGGGGTSYTDSSRSEVSPSSEDAMIGLTASSEVRRRRRQNFEGKDYFSEVELRKLVNPAFVEKMYLYAYNRSMYRNSDRSEYVSGGPQLTRDQLAIAVTRHRWKIFTILVLIHQVPAIDMFVSANLTDMDLPFSLEDLQDLSLRNNWALSDPMEFHQKQFMFPHRFESSREIALLNPRTMLPIKAKYRVGFERPTLVEGEIFHIEIDEEFDLLQHGKTFGCGNNYTLKIAPATDQTKKEISTLTEYTLRMSNLSILPLLCTVRQENQYYLIFPWAPQDLESFMKDNTHLHRESFQSRIDFLFAMSRLVSGVLAIYTGTSKTSDRATDGEQSEYTHGELRPSSIFKVGDNWIIADFGFTPVEDEKYCFLKTQHDDEGAALVGASKDMCALGGILLQAACFAMGGQSMRVSLLNAGALFSHKKNPSRYSRNMDLHVGKALKRPVEEFLNRLQRNCSSEESVAIDFIGIAINMIQQALRDGFSDTNRIRQFQTRFSHLERSYASGELARAFPAPFDESTVTVTRTPVQRTNISTPLTWRVNPSKAPTPQELTSPNDTDYLLEASTQEESRFSTLNIRNIRTNKPNTDSQQYPTDREITDYPPEGPAPHHPLQLQSSNRPSINTKREKHEVTSYQQSADDTLYPASPGSSVPDPSRLQTSSAPLINVKREENEISLDQQPTFDKLYPPVLPPVAETSLSETPVAVSERDYCRMCGLPSVPPPLPPRPPFQREEYEKRFADEEAAIHKNEE